MNGIVPIRRLRNARCRDSVRAVVVQDITEEGCQEKVVDLRSIEESSVVEEVIVAVDPDLETKIKRSLRFYRNTLLYIAVMVTIMFIIYIFERF